MGLLSLAIWTPIAFGVVLLALGRDEHANAVRWIALVGALVSLAVTVPTAVPTGAVSSTVESSSAMSLGFVPMSRRACCSR